MGLVLIGQSGDVVEAGARASKGLHVIQKPVDHNALGHYRVTHRCQLVNAQAANSRLFTVRNTHASNLIVPTRLILKWLITGAHTSAIEDSIDCYKATGFSVVDTTNTVTLTPSVKRTSGMAVVGNSIASIRGLTITGVAAGMTGGTITRDAAPFFQGPKWLLNALPTAGENVVSMFDVFDDVNGTHPFVWAQNEGLSVENRVLLGAAASSDLYVDFSWVETTAF
jgi:hypothetical protein